MKKWLPFFALLCGSAWARTTTPIVQPHETFVNASGLVCAGCSLYSYTAGTTTAQPTYTDSSGTSQNTNPIVLGTDGGANIWLGATPYKFVLKDVGGAIIWTVDNVKSLGSLTVSPPAYSVQVANSTSTDLTSDPTIYEDTASHILYVGGPIVGNKVTVAPLSDVPAPWTFDITSPTTALGSLSPIPLSNLSSQAANSVVMNATDASAPPTAVSLPSGCTYGTNYDSVAHTWGCISSVLPLPLTNLQTQSADTVVMNATGGSATPTAVALPTGCSGGMNYSTSTHTWSCLTAKVCTGTVGTAPWSCYRVYPDGEIEAWGVVNASTSANSVTTGSITFPNTGGSAFTVTPELQVSLGNTPDGATYDAQTVYFSGLSTSGTTVRLRCAVNIGGSGCSTYSVAVPINWRAAGQ